MRLRITEGLSANLHEQVLTGKLDATVVSNVEPMGLLSSRALLAEPLYLVGSIHNQLTSERAVSIDSLLKKPMVLTSSPNAIRTLVDRQLSALGQKLHPLVETNSARLLCDLVMRGVGYTVLPYRAIHVAHRSGQLSAAPHCQPGGVLDFGQCQGSQPVACRTQAARGADRSAAPTVWPRLVAGRAVARLNPALR